MSVILEIMNIVAIAGTGLIIGIVLNSKNTIGLVNAVGDVFVSTFGVAASTIR